MDIDYSLVLLALAVVCGVVWLFDVLFLLKPRMAQFNKYIQTKSITEDEVQSYLDEELSEGESERTEGEKQKNILQAVTLQQESITVEYARSFFPILFAVLVFRSFLFEPFQIPTGSMIPSLNVGDFIVVNKYSYGLRLPVLGTKILPIGEPQRGDVMVFIPPHDPSYYVKRVVGLPGDHVRYEDKVIYINGEPMEQEFVEFLSDRATPVLHAREQLGEVNHAIYMAPTPRYMGDNYFMQPEGRTIPEGFYYMMGDNRDNSDDSRRWGLVPEANIVGKAVAVWMHKEPGLHWPSFSQDRFINP